MPLQLRLHYADDDIAPQAAQLILGLVLLLVADAIWFSLTKPVYAQVVETQKHLIDLRYGLLAWCALALGISAIDRHQSWDRIAASGALIGFVSYATFNGTEAALREDWRSTRLILADMSWGTTSCCLCATLAALTIKSLEHVR